MQFGHLEHAVTDPLASMRFYVDALGFKLEVNQADRFIWLTHGELTILLRPRHARDGATGAHDLVLYTDTLADDVAALESHGVALTRHGNCYEFADPDGHRFQLVNPTDDHSGG